MKILKIIAIAVVLLLLSGVTALWLISDPLPKGTEGPPAEALADKMLSAINKDRFDTLRELRWSFPRGHHFVWNKKDNLVNVKWGEFEVELDPETQTGNARKEGAELTGEEQREAVNRAWALFANDSFWLVAPFKIRDSGTSRQLIETKAGPALLVTYTSGGVTPGDSYLWLLDDSGRPTAWRMWVSILPWKGIQFTWEGWIQKGGVWFAPLHKGPGPVSVDLLDLQVR